MLSAYALFYGAFGMQSPFVPALLKDRGLQAEHIGLVLSVAMVVRVLGGPIIAYTADRRRRHTLMLCGCGIFAALATVSYLTAYSFAGLFCVALLHGVMLGPIPPISDALGATAAHRERFHYGWLRGAGSAAFALGTLVSGWQAELPAAMLTSGALLILAGLVSLMLPGLPSAGATVISAGMLRDALNLLQLPVYRRILIAATLVGGSHALHDSFSVIRWRGAGMELFTVSMLWSEAVLAEVLMFFLLGPWLIRRIGPGKSMALAALAGVLRWSIAAFTTSPWIFAAIQPLHGMTFALFHLAAIQLIVATVPIQLAATAQAIYGTLCVGLAIALLTFISGLLFASMGGLAFLLMAALCLMALPVCMSLRNAGEAY
ncbi:MAG: MFS transporter [Pirellulaceae bacterium]